MIWQDRLHWEIPLPFKWFLERWCEGAPCSLRNYEGRHPIRLTRIR